jgi:hypothetical protein
MNTFIQLPVIDVAVTTPVTATIDKVKLWDGSDQLQINTDGSLNVRPSIIQTIYFDEVFSVVASGSYTVILTKVVTAGTILYSYEASGDTVAEFIVKLNGNIIDHKWSYWTNFSIYGNLNQQLSSGDTLQILVRHQRPSAGNFSAKLLLGA